MRQARGFTLPELLTALALLALVAAFSLPALGAGLERMRTTLLMRDWLHAMQLTRSLAIGRPQAQVTLCGSPDGRQCSSDWSRGWLVFDDRNGNRRLDAGETLHRVGLPAGDGRLLWQASGARSYLRFTADGFAREFGSLTYCPASGDARLARQIIVSMGGRPRLARDRDGDGIAEGSDGRPLDCAAG